jgi:hypothetical protein
MANNQYVNKVQFGNQTLIDLTSDTVTADKLMQGYTAHDRTGQIITGAVLDGNSLEYGLTDGTSSLAGVGKVDSMIIE